ncbi:hypothetical protein J4221_06490 [Candidatus Pacearchaeota archaeon]|nr:hypothetical protein [Candidatus Pacearchaeota archaeon]
MIENLADKVMNGKYLSLAELQGLVREIRDKRVDDLQFVSFLSALETRNRIKGIDVEESVNFVIALRGSLTTDLEGVICPAGCGGDPIKTINVSTPVSIILASGGTRVLKNGFKSVTGKCGSREILEAMGIEPFLSLEQTLVSVKSVGIGYYDFQNLIVMEKRSGFRSPLNYIGALSHPIKINYKLLGCSDKDQFEKMIPIADELYDRYLLTFNPEIDEISTVSQTEIVEKYGDDKSRYLFDPKKIGINQRDYSEVFASQTPEENAERVLRTFNGESSPISEMFALNAGAGFYIAGKSKSIEEGYELANNLLSDGSTKRKLDEWRNFIARL